MPTGKCKFFNRAKGFGFITDDNEEDTFVHANHLDGLELKEGDEVTFDIEQTDKGSMAINVNLK